MKVLGAGMKSESMETDGIVRNDSRFSRMASLDDSLKDAFADGRIDISAANTLVGLSPGTQRRVAAWLGRNPGRKIGARNARLLIQARLEGAKLDRKGIERVLGNGKNERSYIRVPLSSLPGELTRDEAQAWVERAIEAYRRG